MEERKKLRKLLTGQEQMSESFILSIILGFSGGFQDAYTYMVRNHVFANAQTGNIVLMSTKLMMGEFKEGLHYLWPVLSFILGVLVAELINLRFHNMMTIHWRQTIIVLEILVITAVGFLPQRLNDLANVLVSFSCAMQVQAFRTVGGNIYASTMCIGNLRSGTQALTCFFKERDKKYLIQAKDYFGVILFFAIGAGVGGNLSKALGEHSVWICCGLLLICFFLMELDRQSIKKSNK